MPIKEQCEATLAHYERLATVAHEWNNQVPQAIRAWYAEKLANAASQRPSPARVGGDDTAGDPGTSSFASSAGAAPVAQSETGSKDADIEFALTNARHALQVCRTERAALLNQAINCVRNGLFCGNSHDHILADLQELRDDPENSKWARK